MSAEFDTNTKTIEGWLKEKTQFIIPPYQRPYAWELEQCDQLWNDIYDGFMSNIESYFLGPVVTIETSGKKEIQIIDGQQRFTSLTLLLRAICTYLEKKIERDKKVLNSLFSSGNIADYTQLNETLGKDQSYLAKIQPLIFPCDTNNTGEMDVKRDSPKLHSQVIMDGEIEKLNNILSMGTIKTEHLSDAGVLEEYDPYEAENPKKPDTVGTFYSQYNLDRLITKGKGKHGVEVKFSTYNRNYAYFCNAINDFTKENPGAHRGLINHILERCNIIELRCKSEDDALLIFNTLNTRGLPLQDADIIKSTYLYDKSEIFSDYWKEFSECFEQLQDRATQLDIKDYHDDACIYKHYMYWHYASSSNTNSKELNNLRKYYENHSKSMPDKDTLRKEVLCILKFHLSISEYKDDYCTDRAKLYLDCLSSSKSTGLWRYLLTVFYMKNFYPVDPANLTPKTQEPEYPENWEDLKKSFEEFLNRIMVYMFINDLKGAKNKDFENWCVTMCRKTAKDGTFTFDTIREAENLPIKFSLDRSLDDKKNLFDDDGNVITLCGLIKACTFSDKESDWIIRLYSYLSSNFEQTIVPGQLDKEHILPKRYAATTNPLCNMLGNLILLEHSINIEVQTKNLKAKLAGYGASKLIEVQNFVNSNKDKKEWRDDDIQNRTDTMASELTNYFTKCFNEL